MQFLEWILFARETKVEKIYFYAISFTPAMMKIVK